MYEPITEQQKADALTDAIHQLHAVEETKRYCTAWAASIMQKLYKPRKGDETLLFYHNRLPLEMSAADWFYKYPANEFSVRLDCLTLTAYVEAHGDS